MHLFSLVQLGPLVRDSNPTLDFGAVLFPCVGIRKARKAVRQMLDGRGELRIIAEVPFATPTMQAVQVHSWMGLGPVSVCLLLQYLLQSGTREEPGHFNTGWRPVFGSSRLGIEPKTPGWLVQAQPPFHRGI